MARFCHAQRCPSKIRYLYSAPHRARRSWSEVDLSFHQSASERMAPLNPPRLQFAIIGCGLIGRKRAACMQPGQLRYTCDLDPVRAAELAKPALGCIPLTDYHLALTDPAVDAVIISTLNSSLAPIALTAVSSRQACAGRKARRPQRGPIARSAGGGQTGRERRCALATIIAFIPRCRRPAS